MRGLLWVVGAFAAAVALSLALQGDGYVLVTLPPWRVEVSLVFAIAVLLALFWAAYIGIRLAAHTLALPAHVRAFWQRRRAAAARKAFLTALQSQLEGRYARVEKFAGESWEKGENPALSCLIAARAAQRRHDFKRRDEWLDRAQAGDPEWRNARLSLQAELLIEERRYEDAKRVIRQLHAGGLRHLSSQQLLLRCEQALGNWEEVIRLAQLLAKRNAMTPEALAGVLSGAHVAQLARLVKDPARLAQYWRALSAAQRANVRVASAAARAFIEQGDGTMARRVIENALEAGWDEELVLLYGNCAGADTMARIERCEAWLQAQARDPALLLVLGELCSERELWGKAQSYLEASQAARPSRSAHIALARLFEKIGRVEDANREYRASAAEAPIDHSQKHVSLVRGMFLS